MYLPSGYYFRSGMHHFFVLVGPTALTLNYPRAHKARTNSKKESAGDSGPRDPAIVPDGRLLCIPFARHRVGANGAKCTANVLLALRNSPGRGDSPTARVSNLLELADTERHLIEQTGCKSCGEILMATVLVVGPTVRKASTL